MDARAFERFELYAQDTPNQPVDAIDNAYVDHRIHRKRRTLSSNDCVETAPVERTRLNPTSSPRRRTILRCREQARRVYYGAVSETKKEIPA